MNAPSYTLTNDSITVILDGKTLCLRREHKNFDAARKAIIEERWDDLPTLLSPGHFIEKWLGEGYTFVDNVITYNGEPVEHRLNDRMLKMAANGESPLFLFRFWARLQNNPSYRSVNQLYTFLVHEGIPIDEDGCILAYKAVTADYKDYHTQKIDNRPGVTNKMPRNKISDDPNFACHEGFHVGAIGYASTFGSSDRQIVICKVDPANVVCVPFDASAMKVRVCEYTVIGNYSGKNLPDTIFMDEEPDEYDDRDPEDYTFDEPEDMHEHPVAPDDDIKVPAANTWAKYDAMGESDLMNVLFPDLRKYARWGLQMIGVSKMAGDKADLVKRIIEVRRK